MLSPEHRYAALEIAVRWLPPGPSVSALVAAAREIAAFISGDNEEAGAARPITNGQTAPPIGKITEAAKRLAERHETIRRMTAAGKPRAEIAAAIKRSPQLVRIVQRKLGFAGHISSERHAAMRAHAERMRAALAVKRAKAKREARKADRARAIA